VFPDRFPAGKARPLFLCFDCPLSNLQGCTGSYVLHSFHRFFSNSTCHTKKTGDTGTPVYEILTGPVVPGRMKVNTPIDRDLFLDSAGPLSDENHS